MVRKYMDKESLINVITAYERALKLETSLSRLFCRYGESTFEEPYSITGPLARVLCEHSKFLGAEDEDNNYDDLFVVIDNNNLSAEEKFYILTSED